MNVCTYTVIFHKGFSQPIRYSYIVFAHINDKCKLQTTYTQAISVVLQGRRTKRRRREAKVVATCLPLQVKRSDNCNALLKIGV